MTELSQEEKQKLFGLLEDIARTNSAIALWLEFVYREPFKLAYRRAFKDNKEQDVFEAIDGKRSVRDIAAVTKHGKMTVQNRISWLCEKEFIAKNQRGRYQHSLSKVEIAQKYSMEVENTSAGER